MPASGSGESEAGAGPVHCSQCGAPVEPADRFCRSCGAEQPPASQSYVHDDETGQLTGSGAEGLEGPTAESTRVEAPTERQPHAEETEAIAASSAPPYPPAAPPPALPPPAAPPPRLPPLPKANAPPPREPEPGPFEPPKPARRPVGGRRKLIAIAIAVALGLVAGLVAVIAINGRDSASQAQRTTEQTTATTLDPVESLRAHFDLLEQGRFLAASDDLTPTLLDSLGGKTIWVSERIADLVIAAQLDATVIDLSDTTATVRVNSLRTDSLINGCTDFVGTYGLVRSGDRWLIDSADLTDTPC